MDSDSVTQAPSLDAEHAADLRRSGLTDETIAAAGIKTLSEFARRKELGSLASKVSSAYLLPYNGCDGFARVKLFPPLDGMKYSQRPGTACRLYLTPGASSALKDPSVELFIVEGEKKSLRLAQEGLASVGIGGIWNWRHEGRAIEDFAPIDWCDRKVTLVPDSDAWTRDDLRQPVFALAKEIESRGGKVSVVKLPQADESKFGADDFLQEHTLEEFLALPTFGLRHAVWTQARDWWKEWIKGERQASSADSTFQDVEPAEDSVDGAALVKELRSFVGLYVVMSREAVLAVVLWVLTTWTLAAYSTAPILNVTSPAKRCGKTRLLQILAMIVKRALAASNISAAAVFRSIDKWHPTLLVDEADSFLASNDELRGVLNSSHYRSGAFVVRVVGEQLEPKQFSTWCAKAIAGIGKLRADTLDDRSIRIPLKRKSRADSVERLVHVEAESKTKGLRRKLARWSADNLEELQKRVDRLDVPKELDDRSSDNWRPLLCVAELCGLRDEARKVAIGFAGEKSDDSASVLLLEDMKAIFDGREAAHSKDVVEALLEREDRPWQEWRKSKPITPRQVARLLEPYEIRPKQVWVDGANRQGYRREDFAEAFSRYLTPRSPRTQAAQQVTRKNETLGNEHSRGSNSPLTDSKQTSLGDLGDKTPYTGAENGSAHDFFAVAMLEQLGGRLQKIPLTTAIQREHSATLAQAELLLGLAVDAGAIVEAEGWYSVAPIEPGLPL